MQTKIIERYFFFGLLLGTLLFTFLIFKPFWVVLVLGVSFSIVLHPIYEWMRKNKLPDWLASLLTLIFFILVLVGPILFMGTLVFNQSQNIYQNIVTSHNTTPFLNSLNQRIGNFLPNGVTFDANEKVREFISLIFNNMALIFSATLNTLFAFFLMLLSIFYFLKDGERWKKSLIILSPLAESDDEKIISRLYHSINGVIKGSLLVSSVQGILLGIGFTVFGVPAPALWGVTAFFVSFVPIVGTAMVWVPAVLFLFMTQGTTAAIGLGIWAIVEVIIADNFLSPLVLGRKVDIPPLLMLFSLLGGLSLFGPVGILVGPLVISLLYALVSIYRNEITQIKFPT